MAAPSYDVSAWLTALNAFKAADAANRGTWQPFSNGLGCYKYRWPSCVPAKHLRELLESGRLQTETAATVRRALDADLWLQSLQTAVFVDKRRL